MTQTFELYATGSAEPDRLWAVVGDLRRLGEWTDLGTVERVAPEPVAVGTEVVTAQPGASDLTWRVVTAEPRLVEMTTSTTGTTTSVGWRVVRDPRGSRLIVAGAVDRSGRMGAIRSRLVDLPGWRRRIDAWTRRALRAAER